MCLIKKYKSVFIFVFILLIGLIGCVIVFNTKIDKPVARIYQNNELVYEIDLSTVEENEILTFGNDKDYNRVLIEKNNICVIEASCPDHICINQGKINSGITPIVCLPNKFVIKIENNHTVADAITG